MGQETEGTLARRPPILKNPFAHERGLLIGAAQSQLTRDKFSSKMLLVSSSVTKTMAEDVEGFEPCVEAERIGSRFCSMRHLFNCIDVVSVLPTGFEKSLIFTFFFS